MSVELKDGFKCSYYAMQYTDHCTANIYVDFFTVQCLELKLKHVWLKLITAVQKGHSSSVMFHFLIHKDLMS